MVAKLLTKTFASSSSAYLKNAISDQVIFLHSLGSGRPEVAEIELVLSDAGESKGRQATIFLVAK